MEPKDLFREFFKEFKWILLTVAALLSMLSIELIFSSYWAYGLGLLYIAFFTSAMIYPSPQPFPRGIETQKVLLHRKG
ncbi:MAG: hypothetical protein HY805_00325 [Nitrospirae bacterium]|nr:hypothetical protein [Nitrospirota bacterium]